jgi:hypothetical protein
MSRDGDDGRLPRAQIALGVVEHVSSLDGLLVRLDGVAGDYRRIVEQVEQSACMLGEDDLLLGAFDDGGEVDVEGFLDFLPGLLSLV